MGGSVGHLVTDDDIVSTSIEIWSSSLENAYGVTNHTEGIDSSMYPFAYIAHNMGQESMIGKLVLNGFDHLDPNPEDKLYDGGKMFVEAYLCGDYAFMGNTYFNLPTIEEILDGLDKEGKKK